MTSLADEIGAAIAEAVKGLRACDYSWAEIGSLSGITARPLSSDGEHHRDPAVSPPSPP